MFSELQRNTKTLVLTIYRVIWQQVHRRETGLKSPESLLVLRTKFPKEQSLVHKTTNLCATQNTDTKRNKNHIEEKNKMYRMDFFERF